MEPKTRMILPLLVVFLSIPYTGQAAVLLCPIEKCAGIEPPSDPSNCSDIVQMSWGEGSCICLHGQSHLEPCKRDGDCITGFDCHPNKNICVCPCDNPAEPFCLSPFAKCVMNGINPVCKCFANYRCSDKDYFPVCVIWANGTVNEYCSECFFVTESCRLSKNDWKWRVYHQPCNKVEHLLDSQQNVIDFRYKKEIVLNESALAVINWNPSMPEQTLLEHGFYPRPEPVSEPEAEPMK